MVLNWAKEYYKSDKKKLKDQARNKYRELSEEERNIKREYGRNRYHNMSKEKKQKLKEQKIIAKLKSFSLVIISITNCSFADLFPYLSMYFIIIFRHSC